LSSKELIKERVMDDLNDTESMLGRPESSRLGFQPRTSNSTLDTVKETVAEKLHVAAGAIQDKAGQNPDNPVSSYASQAAGFLDDAANYVRQVDPGQVKSDIQRQVRRNPGKSLLIAGVVGLMFGVLVRR
jgi:ElaB/YqjD/DUF883 family membrane-anchored ribosome-binding protein